MQNFKDLSREERKAALAALGEKPFREKQIFEWICKGVSSWDEMTNLSLSLRNKLSETYSLDGISVAMEQISADGTRKYLLELPDGNKVEAVFMMYSYGNSLCISTQVGCAMGCRFCASTIGGKIRNMKAWEMMDEFILCEKTAGAPINHLVLMGIGEPLDNYSELSEFLRNMHDPECLNMSYRNITVSTCGLIPKMDEFIKDFPQVNLAVSLHAGNQKERAELMPIASVYKLDELISCCRRCAETTSRRITFEYALIAGKNDTKEKAAELLSLLKGMLCHINLIPLNPVTEAGLKGSSREAAERFKEMLEEGGIPCTIRRSLGRDIDAACGQLRNKAKK